MVSVKDAAGGLPLSATSSSSTSTLGSSSSASSSTTTQFLNVLTHGGPSVLELTQVQHYNDLQWPRGRTMKTVKDVNIKRGHDAAGALPDVWKSTAVRDYTHRKLTHGKTIRESDFYKETSLDRNQADVERNINLNVEPGISSLRDDKTNYDINCKIQNNEVKANNSGRDTTNDEPPAVLPKLERTKSWWKGKLPLRASVSSNPTTSSVIPSSLKRTRFWNSLSRTFELPERLRKEDKKIKKVPKLQIWLSTDSRGTELSDVSEPSVLNNTRDAVPRIQFEQPKVINRSLIDCARWRALSEGSSPAAAQEGSSVPGRSNLGVIENGHSGPKSPVEKQPTWPVCHLLQPRPKLIHQNCLNTQIAWNQEFLNKRLELPRQNAISDDAENKENEVVKTGDAQLDWKRGSFSTESQASTSILSNTFCDSKWSLRPRLSTGGQATLGINLFLGRKGASSASRSYSDEKSEVFESNFESGGVDAPSFNSVFSLTDPPSTPSYSWESSHASLNSDFPGGSQLDPSLDTRRDRSSSFNHEFLSPVPGARTPCTRSLSSTSATIFNFGDKAQFRLTIPSAEGSRRPSLLSLRSMGRSPIPYVSMDYDYDSDYELVYGGHGGLIPEAAPKLSFTQKLAFPTLYQNSIDRPKPRDPYTEADNNMNTVAKIITVVILTFVTVFILGGLFKLLH